jgi:hypothetical protein
MKIFIDPPHENVDRRESIITLEDLYDRLGPDAYFSEMITRQKTAFSERLAKAIKGEAMKHTEEQVKQAQENARNCVTWNGVNPGDYSCNDCTTNYVDEAKHNAKKLKDDPEALAALTLLKAKGYSLMTIIYAYGHLEEL